MAEQFHTTWTEEDCNIHTDSIFEFDFVSEKEILELVKKIDISKSSAIENLSSRILKDCFEVLTLELTQLYNVCLMQGKFPKDWGLGFVTPIPKVNVNNKEPKNWRPIAQIKLPGKLLERIVHSQLMKYLTNNNILDNNQHGFRPGKSTSTAIFDMSEILFENWSKKKVSTCTFIDFSRAFDSLDHRILLSKLKLYGLDARSISFMESYIDNPYQCTKVNGYTSASLKLRYGTAQGSILGPLIFILYVNDLFKEVIEENTILMYADDTLLITEGQDIQSSLEKESNCIEYCDSMV